MQVRVIPIRCRIVHDLKIGRPGFVRHDGGVRAAVVFGRDVQAVPMRGGRVAQFVVDVERHGLTFFEDKCWAEVTAIVADGGGLGTKEKFADAVLQRQVKSGAFECGRNWDGGLAMGFYCRKKCD